MIGAEISLAIRFKLSDHYIIKEKHKGLSYLLCLLTFVRFGLWVCRMLSFQTNQEKCENQINTFSKGITTVQLEQISGTRVEVFQNWCTGPR